MILTDEMKLALDIINEGKENLFITGKAGTGKTTFLKYVVSATSRKIVVVAPTGVAAVNAGGMTIHSLFCLPFGIITPEDLKTHNKYLKKDKKNTLKTMDTLIIDEISMVRPDCLDAIDSRLRDVRKNNSPFGGVKIIMIGDLFQLPPVISETEKSAYEFLYNTPYFFGAKVWLTSGFRQVEFTQVYRQTEPEFIDLLNRMRTYNTTFNDLLFLANTARKNIDNDQMEKYIYICSHNSTANRINMDKLGLDNVHIIKSHIYGDFPETYGPCSSPLYIRVGARVINLANDSKNKIYNGDLGVVTKIDNDYIRVKFDDKQEVDVYRKEWINYKYNVVGGQLMKEPVGSMEQFPLKLAWAITIHKSQGLTFKNVLLDIDQIFLPGQLYVALSRCVSPSGLIINSYITEDMILPDEQLIKFNEYMKNNNYIFGTI